MSDDVLVAFDRLLKAMDDEMKRLGEAVLEATLNAPSAEARRLVAKTKRAKRLMEQTRQLQEAWKRLDDEAAETSEIGQHIAEGPLGASAEADEAPELAIADRLFGGSARTRGQRRRVNKTPKDAYRVPILEALEQLGGKGPVEEVLDIVYQKMRAGLTEDDRELLPSSRMARWRNTAHWARLHLVKDGLLRNDSPMGIWEVTEAGRAYWEQKRRGGMEGDEP